MKKTSYNAMKKILIRRYEKDFLLGAMKKTSTNAKKKTSYNAIPIIMFNISRQSFFVSTSHRVLQNSV